METSFSFMDNLPKDFDFLQLGMPYDSLKDDFVRDSEKRLKPPLFKVGALSAQGLIIEGSTSKNSLFIGSSNHQQSLEAVSHSLSISAKGSLGPVKMSAGFKTANVSTSKDSSSYLGCQFSAYISRSLYITSDDTKRDELFSSLSPEFQADYEAIMNEIAPSEKAQKYIEFKRKYGDGYVSYLDLIAISFVNSHYKIASSEDSVETKSQQTSSVGFFSGGVSEGYEWGKRNQNISVTGDAKVESRSYPADTPTDKWATDIENKLIGKSIDELSEKATFSNLPSPEYATFPEIPEFKAPENKKVPEDKSESNEDANKQTKKKLLEEQKSDEGYQGSIDDYEEKIDAEIEALNSEETKADIIRDRANTTPLLSTVSFQQNQQVSSDKTEAQLTENSDEFHPYYKDKFKVLGFQVTLWKDIFPDLAALENQISMSTINTVKLMTYYYQQLQFKDWCLFLNSLGVNYHFNSQMESDCERLKKKIEDLYKVIQANTSNVLTIEKYNSIKNNYEEIFSDASSKKYSNSLIVQEFVFKSPKETSFKRVTLGDLYNLYINNYEEYFEDAEYGFLLSSDKEGRDAILIGYEENKIRLLEKIENPKYYKITYKDNKWDITCKDNYYYKLKFETQKGLSDEDLYNKSIRFYPALRSEMNYAKGEIVQLNTFVGNEKVRLVLDYVALPAPTGLVSFFTYTVLDHIPTGNFCTLPFFACQFGVAPKDTYYDYMDNPKIKVGYKSLKERFSEEGLSSLKILGFPMMSEMPFDILKSFNQDSEK